MKSQEEFFQEMISLQKEKLLKLAQEIIPHIIEEDLLQPFDFPKLEGHPGFRYEEGVLEGMLTVCMALRALQNETTC